MDTETRNRNYLILFVIALLFDIGIISYAVITTSIILLTVMVVAAVVGGYFLLQLWNYDERTEQALRLASVDTIRIYLVIAITGSLAILTYSNFNELQYWEIGATLAVSSLLIIYLQAFTAVIHDNRMK